MQKPNLLPLFRIFSANHWNQPEIIIPLHSSSTAPLFQKSVTFFSNAEKLRKFVSLGIQNSSSELSRTTRSNGFTILFSLIQNCFSLTGEVR